MKLGLLGHPVSHSRSPELYRKFLGDNLVSYELFDYPIDQCPELIFFRDRLDGLNITTPHKKTFFHEVEVDSFVSKIGAINTIGFKNKKAFGTNTDALALMRLMPEIVKLSNAKKIILLGDGVMANLTEIISYNLNIQIKKISRKQNGFIQQADLSDADLVINACSRSFNFQGKLNPNTYFWDYNYSSPLQEKSILNLGATYIDGLSLLEKQAQEAVKFWQNLHP